MSLREAPSTAKRANRWRAAFFVLLVVAALGAVFFTPLADYMDEDRMVATFEMLRHAWWAPLLLVALYTFTAPLGIPMTPYVVGGAVVFGFVHGTIYNVTGLVVGAAASYYLARAMGRDFVAQLARGRLQRYEDLFDRAGFWPLVQTRFMPLPFPVVNFGAALAGVKAPLFLTASLVGLVPSTVVHTFFIAALYEASADERKWIGAWYIAVLVGFNLLTGFPTLKRLHRGWRRRRRYRELTTTRRERGED